jgi:hypothetical protein
VHCVAGEPAATPNLTLCQRHIDEVTALLTEDDDAILADSAGYRGLRKLGLNVITPYGGSLDSLAKHQLRHNQALASERVVSRRYYARLKTMFRIMSSKYRASRQDYCCVFTLCVALTNYHILLYPLQ